MIRAAFLLSASVCAGCATDNAAPVVYGSQPLWQGRVYNSPDEIKAEIDAAAPPRTAARPLDQSAPDQSAAAAPKTAQSNAAATSVSNAAYPALGPDEDAYDFSVRDRREADVRASSGGPAFQQASATRSQGTVVRLTPIETTPSKARAKPAAKSAKARSITVAKGDSVYAIARRVGVEPAAIIARNHLRAPYQLAVGQKLLLPEQKSTRAASARDATKRAASSTQTKAAASKSGRAHTVKRGETLYRIALNAGTTVEEVARLNRIRRPYTIDVGQKLLLPTQQVAKAPAREERTQRVAAAPPPKPTRAPAAPTRAPTLQAASAEQQPRLQRASFTTEAKPKNTALFEWPVRGAVIARYDRNAAARNDGVNIAAPIGTPVRAAASGEVVYRGSELEDYGNLLLIRHTDGYVTAYAHNDVLLVEKGQEVRQGQVIAKVGRSGSADQPQLHFEIRRNLKAIDPLKVLGT